MQNRLKKVKEAMNTKGVSALLVTKSENQVYLTGFHSSNYQLLITADTNYLLTDFRYIEAAGELAPLYYVVLTDHNVTLYTFLKELGIKELAIEDSSII
jgi:Xaa-Pro aminopeptidase